MADLRETRHVDAPPDDVYDLVADLPRMGEWSPECERVTWRGEASEAAKGVHFIGHNRAGAFRWVTQGEVVATTRGRHLAFEITVGPVRISRWEYLFVPDEGGAGCTVVEEWTDRRPRVYAWPVDRLFGSRSRTNAAGMRMTLDAVKRAAESSPTSGARSPVVARPVPPAV